MKRTAAPSKRRPRSGKSGPSAKLRLRTEPAEVTGPSTKLKAGSLRPSSGRVLRPSSGQALADFGIETEMPLDAEDVALASLEAKVRAEEARAQLSSAEPLAALTIHLPRAVILQLQAQAAERNVTPSKLVELALAQCLGMKTPGRRKR